jgi:hypothetical protein
MRNESIEADMKNTIIAAPPVRVKYLIGYCAVSAFSFIGVLRRLLRSAVMPYDALLTIFYH